MIPENSNKRVHIELSTNRYRNNKTKTSKFTIISSAQKISFETPTPPPSPTTKRHSSSSQQEKAILLRKHSEKVFSTMGKKATKKLTQLIKQPLIDLKEVDNLLWLKANPNDTDIKGNTILMCLVQQIADNKKTRALTISVLEKIIDNSHWVIDWNYRNNKGQTYVLLQKRVISKMRPSVP